MQNVKEFPQEQNRAGCPDSLREPTDLDYTRSAPNSEFTNISPLPHMAKFRGREAPKGYSFVQFPLL